MNMNGIALETVGCPALRQSLAKNWQQYNVYANHLHNPPQVRRMKSWNCAREFELDVGADRDSTGNRATDNWAHPRSGISLWHRLLTPISPPVFEVPYSEIRVWHRFPLWFEGRFITTCPKSCKDP